MLVLVSILNDAQWPGGVCHIVEDGDPQKDDRSRNVCVKEYHRACGDFLKAAEGSNAETVAVCLETLIARAVRLKNILE